MDNTDTRVKNHNIIKRVLASDADILCFYKIPDFTPNRYNELKRPIYFPIYETPPLQKFELITFKRPDRYSPYLITHSCYYPDRPEIVKEFLLKLRSVTDQLVWNLYKAQIGHKFSSEPPFNSSGDLDIWSFAMDLEYPLDMNEMESLFSMLKERYSKEHPFVIVKSEYSVEYDYLNLERFIDLSQFDDKHYYKFLSLDSISLPIAKTHQRYYSNANCDVMYSYSQKSRWDTCRLFGLLIKRRWFSSKLSDFGSDHEKMLISWDSSFYGRTDKVFFEHVNPANFRKSNFKDFSEVLEYFYNGKKYLLINFDDMPLRPNSSAAIREVNYSHKDKLFPIPERILEDSFILTEEAPEDQFIKVSD